MDRLSSYDRALVDAIIALHYNKPLKTLRVRLVATPSLDVIR